MRNNLSKEKSEKERELLKQKAAQSSMNDEQSTNAKKTRAYKTRC